jgi:hypothetical protein
MESKKGSGKIFIIVVSAIILVGAGVGFWLYRKNKKSKEVKEEPSEEGIKSDEVVINSSTDDIPKKDKSRSNDKDNDNDNDNDKSRSSSEITDNPFKTEADLKKFQNWILKYHQTDGTYGKGSATPLDDGADGKWGGQSARAWDKYGKRYVEVTKAVVDKPKPKTDKKPTKANEDLKLKLNSDGSNVSAVKQIINQVALWKKLKTSNGVNFPIGTSTKFDAKMDKALAIFFPNYKSQGYITRGQARLLWSYSAGFYNKTFPSALVGNSNEQAYRSSYAKGKEKAKKKFSGFHNNGDNFVIDANDGDNFI